MFPKTENIFENRAVDDDVKNEIPIQNIEKNVEQLDVGITPSELESFMGDENNKFQHKLSMLAIDKKDRKFLEYLQ